MEQITVSVIIPITNRKCTPDYLNAMYKNTKEKDWELILITDDLLEEPIGYSLKGSDIIFSELKDLLGKNENVHFLKSSNSGYKIDATNKTFRISAAINYGATHAAGKYIFIASDDWYYSPYWLENYLDITKKVNMDKTVIVSINLESLKICEKDDDPKEKMWNTLIEAGRRYMFISRDISNGVDETELIKYFKDTKMDCFDVEMNCEGPLGNGAPIFMLKSNWDKLGGRKLSNCGNTEIDFIDRLKSMGFTKIVPRNIYTFNNLHNRDNVIKINYNWDRKDFK